MGCSPGPWCRACAEDGVGTEPSAWRVGGGPGGSLYVLNYLRVARGERTETSGCEPGCSWDASAPGRWHPVLWTLPGLASVCSPGPRMQLAVEEEVAPRVVAGARDYTSFSPWKGVLTSVPFGGSSGLRNALGGLWEPSALRCEPAGLPIRLLSPPGYLSRCSPF